MKKIAIEAAMGYGQWLHGEAVAAGTCMAADLSVRLGWLEPADLARVRDLIARLGLPTDAPAKMTPEQFRTLMGLDKKVLGGRLRLLLRGIGDGVVTADFDDAALTRTLETCRLAA